ncbi:MAG: bifunctional aspartate kinase/homoserine dehydrogenase I [Prevotellaceae bacterium]|nr:bifunctional aspartate kinase/homoserine dehydrogenase I [Candidatus Faecinaster equi]
MKVIKFGGTSVGTIEGVKNIKSIIEKNDKPLIVVVSALKTVTNNLIKMMDYASRGDVAYKDVLNEISEIHFKHLDEMMPEDTDIKVVTKQKLQEFFEELSSIVKGIYLIKDITDKLRNTIVGYGERCSSLMIANYIDNSQLYDSRNFIITTEKNNEVTVDFSTTNKKVQETFSTLQCVAIVPGFISSDGETGADTTLGRGGSDYTASIIAATLNADSLEIWTDVNGFMTADPHIIPTAYPIEELTYSEAIELCNFGAKVVYPPTIFPACSKNIPIYVKNTFNPSFCGSVISNTVSYCERSIKGLSSIGDTSVVTVSGMSMVGVVGINQRIFGKLAENGISVFMVAQTSSETSTSICMTPEDAKKAQNVLTTEFCKEISTGALNPIKIIDGLATVAVVGENMKNESGISGKLFSILGRNGINIIAMAQGATEMNISFVVDKSLLHKTLNLIHDSFFLSEYQVVNLFICGVGTVGSSLLTQLQEQRQQLMDKRRLKLNVVGVSNSKLNYIDADGISSSNIKQTLLDNGTSIDVRNLKDAVLSMNLYNYVFVDCTANADVASLYEIFLEHNISVVAANKIAASSPYEQYARLKKTALEKGVKFLYETNAGAGLPIIKTISDLCDSGDEIIKIEAVLSGTLNFIFNKLSASNSFSNVICQAMQAGISEPDPRQDLCGKDVVRKLVILAREAGFKVNQEDVELQPFMDAEYFEGSVEDFFNKVTNLDAPFEAKRKSLEGENKKLRFVAVWENNKATVSLQPINNQHPFYHLEDSNNMVLLTTKRYNQYPMIIQGYGAGADVTAAGVFADIIRVAI